MNEGESLMAKGKNKGKKKDRLIEKSKEFEKKNSAEVQEDGLEELSTQESPLANGEMPSEEMLYDLADLFKVFADTTRIKILYALMGNDMCVADIAEAVDVTQSAVSHQLRSMKQAHLVKFRRDGKQVIYSLSDDHVYTMLSQGMTHICE